MQCFQQFIEFKRKYDGKISSLPSIQNLKRVKSFECDEFRFSETPGSLTKNTIRPKP